MAKLNTYSEIRLIWPRWTLVLALSVTALSGVSLSLQSAIQFGVHLFLMILRATVWTSCLAQERESVYVQIPVDRDKSLL